MKKILFLLIVSLAFASCDKKDLPEPKGAFNPQAVITIRVANGVKTRSTVSGLTALEVVQNAVNIKWQSHYFNNAYSESIKDIARTFIEAHRDLQTPALKMWGTDILYKEQEDSQIAIYKDFIHGFNVVITDNQNDTIAYIPDEVINNARPLIEAAFADENYTEVYRIFDEAFTSLPIE